MYIPQKQIENLKNLIAPGKVVVIYGARRVGKTTLLKKFLEDKNTSDILFVNGDDKKEIDFVEERQGKLFGYEIKWTNTRAKAPKEWQKKYPGAEFENNTIATFRRARAGLNPEP